MLRHSRSAPKPVTADKHAFCGHLKRRHAAAIVALMLSGSVFVKGVSAVEILLATLALVAVACEFHALVLSSASFARSMALFSHSDLSSFSLAMRSGVRRTL
jgi:hypothetical protein